jgi:hypothetical protein
VQQQQDIAPRNIQYSWNVPCTVTLSVVLYRRHFLIGRIHSVTSLCLLLQSRRPETLT